MASTAITNAKIFNGTNILRTGTVVFEDGLITDKTSGEINIDGTGCTLLPGLIDSHVHLDSLHDLEAAALCGVTTMLDMATRSATAFNALRNHPGLPSIESCYLPAFPPCSDVRTKMGYPDDAEIKSKQEAVQFVKEQISSGAAYIKILLEEQGVSGGAEFPHELIVAIVEEAHRLDKRVIAHAVSPISYKVAIEAGVDVLTHIPFAIPLPQPIIDAMAVKGCVSVPTMGMMKGIVESAKKQNPQVPFNYEFVRQSVAAIYKAGINILAGTDSNNDPTAPCAIPYGFGLQTELTFMVDAGLTPVEALQSATNKPADYFGLKDRGVIAIGRRADLLLVKGDPTLDIQAIKDVKGVWISGKAVI